MPDKMQGHKMKTVSSFVACVIFITGCASTTGLAKQKITNMTPSALLIGPVQVTYLRDRPPILGKTFSVFPYSVIDKARKRDLNLDRQLLFCFRNLMEGAGYKFVKLDQRPHFLLTIDTRSYSPRNFREADQPFCNTWSAGNKLIRTDSSGVAMPEFGNVDWHDWGEWNPPLKKGKDPGYKDPNNYRVLPVDGFGYYHLVNIQVYDGRTFKNVWMVTALAASRTGNIRITVQSIFNYMVRWFSGRRIPADPRKKGYVGINLSILTVDGKDYYPAVAGVYDKGPAAKAGLKKYDMIVAVNGGDTRNMNIMDALNLIKGEPGSRVKLTVWRVNKLHKFTLTRVPFSSYSH